MRRHEARPAVGSAFGNIEPTNNPGATAGLIRNDTLAHNGYPVALRSVADPRPPGGSHSSLRDVTLLNEAARRKGLL